MTQSVRRGDVSMSAQCAVHFFMWLRSALLVDGANWSRRQSMHVRGGQVDRAPEV